jgi:CelD/BcsL family acetyltransferase involved in cellulose biosynthesis
MIQVEVLSADAGRDEVAAIWRELEAECRPRYWLRWGWMETWLETLPVELRPQLVVVRQGTRPAAAFFVRVTDASRGLLRWRSARLNESGSDAHDVLYLEYNGWLQRPGASVDVAAVLDRLPLAWDELLMRRLDPQLPLALHDAAGRYRVVEISRDPCPLVDLQAARAAQDGYLSLLGKNTRAAIRRSRRAYEERGPIVLERASSEAQALAFLAELGELSQRRFAEQSGGAFDSAYFRRFHEELVRRRLDSGEIALLRLRAGEQTIGLSYNFIDDGVVGFYQSGLCYEDDNRLKPGLLLHAEAIARFAREGLRTYDFLAGKARYKNDLATHAVELRSVRVLRPRAVFVLEEGVDLLRGWVNRLRRR